MSVHKGRNVTKDGTPVQECNYVSIFSVTVSKFSPCIIYCHVPSL